MVHIENKQIKLGGKPRNYANLLSEIIKSTPENGFTFEAMKKHLRIDGKIDPKEKKISLEDSDHDYLIELLKKQKWNILDIGIVEMIDYINKLKKS